MKDIPGFEGEYAVTKNGRVWSYQRTLISKNGVVRKWKGRFLKPSAQEGEYLHVSLGKRKHSAYIHRMVAELFIANPGHLPQVNHKNGVKFDNRVQNLEWMTASENINHSLLLGLKPIGIRHKNAKLDPMKVRRIRSLSARGTSIKKLSRMFSMGETQIRRVVDRLSWKAVA